MLYNSCEVVHVGKQLIMQHEKATEYGTCPYGLLTFQFIFSFNQTDPIKQTKKSIFRIYMFSYPLREGSHIFVTRNYPSWERLSQIRDAQFQVYKTWMSHNIIMFDRRDISLGCSLDYFAN